MSNPKPRRLRRENKAAINVSSFPSFGYISCPPAEESHDPRPKDDASRSIDNMSDGGFGHFFVEKELVCKELNETSVEQDPGAERVEDAAYD